MRRLLLVLLAFLFFSPVLFAQNSITVSISVTDAGGQTWNNGTYTVNFVGPNNVTWPGGTVPKSVSGSLGATGTATQSLANNNTINPSPTFWTFTVCPAAGVSFGCFTTASISVTTPAQAVSITPPAISIAASSVNLPIGAYADSEITSNAFVGAIYTQITSTGASQRICQAVSGNACILWGGSALGTLPGGTSLATNGPGPVFNVKGYGAKGNTQFSAANCTTSNGQNTITCPGANFAAVNVGMRANCGSNLGGGLFFAAGTTISAITSSTVANLSNTTGVGSASASCYWGTVDDAPGGPIPTAVALWQAAQSAAAGQPTAFNNANSPAAPVLLFPAGAYLVCGAANLAVIEQPSSKNGAVIQGDAPYQTWFVPCDTIANSGSHGSIINQPTNSGQLIIKNIAIDGVYIPTPIALPAMLLAGSHNTENINISRWNGSAGFSTSGSGYNLNLVVQGSTQDANAGAVVCNSCSDEFHYGGSSNNGNAGVPNLAVQNARGLNTGMGPRFYSFLNDECGSFATGCTKVTNSSDVWFIGSSLFSTASGQALNVDGTSFVHVTDGIIGVFGTDNNATGLKIQAGGVVQSQDVRYVGTGTGKCINNSGIFNDNGGNTCESQFPIASGTSTGTTAVLTLTNVGAAINTNCSVGDALFVQGAGIAGYNGYYPAGATSGITATSATTVTYTTSGSNLGALSAGGTAYCRNLQTYTGNLPRALLNNPIPNTCYITGTFAATTTAAPMCAFTLGSATNVTAIKATSTTTTACTVAPVVTITDGTQSETLTITTAKSIWDSSVDASTGVGTTIFKPNGTITLSNTAGTCTTPPTNFSVSYNISPILSN